MSLRHTDDELALTDRDRDSAAYAAEDARWMASGPLPCEDEDCDCPRCMPELYDAAEQKARRAA